MYMLVGLISFFLSILRILSFLIFKWNDDDVNNFFLSFYAHILFK